ncbi:MAG: bifunctional 2-C-methyl-D-erythritol 4-phosphate cytidylyltransferase/2-C-methyl-D-erythritol 2,4-cyclodiphosphate synthase [Sphingosinicella sp.]|nr:bifunctional 2-C-methyl-D-erythritol 4-phosphate cytidylyltransferase/2-C-methyl-D-erythritol 2,4-cyclodiphosphate synthase [Sphingosinicella sp.]
MTRGGKCVALVAAAGSGNRAGASLPKQYARLAGKTLLAHAVERLDHPRIHETRVIIGTGQEEYYRESGVTLPHPIIGGPTRQRSVRNGLEAIAAEGGADIVLIHDAARPFLPGTVIDRLIDALASSDGAVPTLPLVDSLARVDDQLCDNLSRENIHKIQTPQAFHFDIILASHRQWDASTEATDDAQVARAAGYKVASVAGSHSLEKVTLADDFAAAEQRLAASFVSRTGLGFDVHAFAEGEDLWLGGVRIPHARGLSGHSDADVALHALTDALLGAIGGGDIGDHFPPGDPQWRGAPSSRFIDHVRGLIASRGGRIDHVDLTIICEAPKIGPHRLAMRQKIADLLGLPLARISVKATTTERLGFTGRSEGIAAQAVATVRVPEEL